MPPLTIRSYSQLVLAELGIDCKTITAALVPFRLMGHQKPHPPGKEGKRLQEEIRCIAIFPTTFEVFYQSSFFCVIVFMHS